MDHHLGDPLNLESAMGVDFEHSENVVSQADIELETGGHEESIPMEFDHIEEQPMLMDTGNEEIIDFMGEQFTLQSYSVDGDQMTGSEVTVEDSQNIDNSLASHSDTMIDLQFDQAPITIPAAVGDVVGNYGPRIITVGSATPEQIIVNKTGAPSNKAVRLAPRQVAIAPKPPRPTVTKVLPKFVPGKQFAIAPKPKQVSLVKKVSLTTAMQANAKGNTVIAQIGKQFVMLPSGDANKKLKLVHTGAGGKTVRLMQSVDSEQAQLIPNQSASSAKHTKIIIQGAGQGGGAGGGGGAAHQPAVITKLLPSGAQPGARFVTVQQKMPVSIVNNNRLVIESPHKGALGGVQRAVIPQIRAGTTATTKKIVISGQNLVLKSTAQPKTTQITKTVTAGQKTQLHPINVPGKGIQYIRLVTNPTAASASVIKTSPKPAQSGKTFVFTDSKGNLIQMASEKMLSGQPPPLVVTGNSNKNAAKPPQRLVRIAPLTSKPQVVMQKDTLRSGQSLLAPISVATPASEPGGGGDVTQPLLADVKQQVLEEQEQSQEDDVTQQLDRPEEILALHEMKTEILQNEVTEETVETDSLQEFHVEPREEEVVTQHDEEEQVDSKAALHALIADAVSSAGAPGGGHASMPLHAVHAVQAGAPPAPAAPAAPAAAHPPPEIQVSFERQQSPNREGDHPLIVIPSFLRNESSAPAETEQVEPRRLMSIDVEPYDVFHSMSPPPESTEADVTNELGLRPRKPCNCTKSQCLKLYCDCFANGEFCNRCNCNNCHNNLENEELRQKAIKGCLDRNPNAFRPKIGKSKNLGPDIVRRHNKGCNCKRSGCLKNYCECYEAKIACSPMCKCVGCRNVEEAGPRARRRSPGRRAPPRPPPPHPRGDKQPCSFMTSEVIEAVCQCLVAAAAEGCSEPAPDPLRDVIHEFARCLQDIIGAASPLCAAADEA